MEKSIQKNVNEELNSMQLKNKSINIVIGIFELHCHSRKLICLNFEMNIILLVIKLTAIFFASFEVQNWWKRNVICVLCVRLCIFGCMDQKDDATQI